jgi:hypothetical protein
VAGQRPGVLELVGGGLDPAGPQVELGVERLRPGQEGQPPFRPDQLERLGQGGRRLAALVAEQVGAGQDRQRPGPLARVAAAFGPLHRRLQVAEGGRVVTLVGGVHAPDAEDGGQLDVGLGQALGPGQPGVGRPAAAGLHLHEAELPVGGHGRLAVAGLGGQPDRLVQDDGPLLVAAPDGVDQRPAQGGQGAGLEGRVGLGGRVGAGAAEAVDPGLDGAGRDGRPAGVELAGDRGPPAGRSAPGRSGRRRGRVPQGGRRRHAELPTQRVVAHRHLPEGGGPVAGGDQAAHQQLVVALLERVAGHRPRGVRHRLPGLARGQQAQRGLP